MSTLKKVIENILPLAAAEDINLTINVISGDNGFTKTGPKTLSVGESWISKASEFDMGLSLELILDAWTAMNKNQNRIRYAGGMSPFELAKFQKYGNVRA